MEVAAAVFSTITTAMTGTAGATAAAGASAAGGAAATGGSFLTSILQGGMGIMGAIGAMREGQQKADALETQAADALTDKKQAELAGMQANDKLRRQLLADQGERDAAYAASGIDLTFGTPAVARAQADEDSERALAIQQASTDMKASRYAERAARYRQAASSAKSGGLLKGLGLLGETAISFAKRG